MTSLDIELALVRHLGTRVNFIVPNVYWGLGFNYELDLLIVKDSGYAYEIEIKTSISDLKAEKKKKQSAHKDVRIRKFYFAIPSCLLEKATTLIPERAGIYTVDKFDKVKLERNPEIRKDTKRLTDEELIKLGKLATMRMWNLKRRLRNKTRILIHNTV